MAINDISLTSAMRSNLVTLQSTVSLLNRTQERLATGKKVNSALDNPTNYFTALSHTSRASDLVAYKDGLSEAVQTIKAADSAISSITKMIESAKAVAEDAKGTLGQTANNQTLTIESVSGISAGNTINVGGTTFTAVSSVSASATQFSISGTEAEAAISLASAINQTTETSDMEATVSNNTLTITPTTAGATMVTADIAFSSALTSNFTESSIGSGTELAAKISQYNTLMSQLDDLKDDAFYKGKNLLNAEDMTVRFGNSHTLSVAGFDASASGLSLDTTASSWVDEDTIQSSISKMDTSLTNLRTESSKLSNNLSIVNVRDEWITAMSNTLMGGADKLTLADTNEEGANMLMLQTRQSLGTTSLSLASQAAQSVMRLFG